MPRRTRRPLRVIGIVGAVGAVPFAALWMVGSSLAERTAAKQAVPVVEPAAPVLSARRAPATLAIDIAVRNLDTRLDALEKALPTGSCLLVDAGGRTASAVRADQNFEPASNAKIVTASVVLDVLPPDTVFTTRVLGTNQSGTVLGNLVLKGGGDPLLVTKDYLPLEKYPKTTPTLLDTLADQVVSLGITRVSGSVVGDESYLDDTRYMKGWGSGIRATEGGPLGALLVNDGVVVSDPIKPDNPALSAAREFTRLLKARGIAIGGEPTTGTADAALTELTSIASAPLRDVVAEMLTNSNNNSAELLLRHVGLAARQTPTSQAGLEVVAELLDKWGFTDTVLQDGSGLSRGSKISCATLVDLLERAPTDSVLRTGLALAGKTGTLTDTFVGSPIEGRFRGKTGTLTNVKTLSGILPVDNSNDAVLSALMLNGTGLADQGNYRPLWDRLASAIATYPQGPAASSLSVAALSAP